MTDIREVLHLYLGCECLYGIKAPIPGKKFILTVGTLFWAIDRIEQFTPILSRLSDMTEEDAKQSRELFDRLNEAGKLNGEIEAERTVWALSKGYWLFGDEAFDKGLIIDRKTLKPLKDSNERSKTKEEILKNHFYLPESRDWYGAVQKAMQEYADQEVARLIPSKVKEEEKPEENVNWRRNGNFYSIKATVASSHTEGSEDKMLIPEKIYALYEQMHDSPLKSFLSEWFGLHGTDNPYASKPLEVKKEEKMERKMAQQLRAVVRSYDANEGEIVSPIIGNIRKLLEEYEDRI